MTPTGSEIKKVWYYVTSKTGRNQDGTFFDGAYCRDEETAKALSKLIEEPFTDIFIQKFIQQI